MDPLNFIRRKVESPDEVCDNALKLFENDFDFARPLLSWITMNLCRDPKFRDCKKSWTLLHNIIKNGNFNDEKFSFLMKPLEWISCECRKEALMTLELILKKYPQSHRLVLDLTENVSLEDMVKLIH